MYALLFVKQFKNLGCTTQWQEANNNSRIGIALIRLLVSSCYAFTPRRCSLRQLGVCTSCNAKGHCLARR